MSRNAFLIWLSLAQLIAWGSTVYLFGLLVQPIEAHLGINRGQTSLAYGLCMLAEGALAYPLGRLIDAGHGREVMASGSVLCALALVGISQVANLYEFYAAWIALGAAMAGVLYTPVFSIVTRRFPENFRHAIITITFLGGLASTVFIPFIAWLMHRLGWSQALLVLAALHLCICLPIHWFLLVGEPPSLRSTATHAFRSPRFVLTSQQRDALLLIGIFTAFGMSVTGALAAHLIPILKERGLAEYWVIWIPASIGVIQVIGRALIMWTEGKLDTHRSNFAVVGLMSVSLVVLLAAGSNSWALLAFALLFGLANGCLTIVKGTAIAQYVSHQNVAALNGSLGLPIALARAFVPWGIGVLWSPDEGYSLGIVCLLGMSIIAAISFFFAQRRSNTYKI